MKNIKIIPPKGYEIDKNLSTFEEIVFKKIDEKLYEILSVYGRQGYGNSTTTYTVENETVLVSPDGHKYPQKDLSLFDIHSIKRLPDGEIFKIGDNTTRGKITKIILNATKNCFGINTDRNFNWSGQNTFQHRKPLLITEDGIDLFENDEYYVVYTKHHYNLIPFKIYGSYKVKYNHDKIEREDSSKIFHSIEKAEEFILYNKPLNISLNDILSVWGVDEYNVKKTLLFNKIKTLVK